MNSYAKELKRTKNLFAFGIGGSMNADVKILSPTYISSQKLNVDEARVLFIETVEGLVSKMNTDENIRPFLHDYPSTEKNTAIGIVFFDENNEFLQDDFIALISMLDNGNGMIYYAIYNTETKKLEDCYEEPYEEALRIVKEQKAAQEFSCD
jgi:hypothetical protein